MGVTFIRRDMNVGDDYECDPGIGHFIANQLGKLLPEGFGDALGAVIHLLTGIRHWGDPGRGLFRIHSSIMRISVPKASSRYCLCSCQIRLSSSRAFSRALVSSSKSF